MPRQLGVKQVEVDGVTFTLRWSFENFQRMQTLATQASEGGEMLADQMVWLEALITDWDGFVDAAGEPIPFSRDKIKQLTPDDLTGIMAAIGLGEEGNAGSADSTKTDTD